MQRFSDMASAQEAVAKYDQGSFLGATIKVEMSHNQGPTRNSKITCFNCGAEGHYARHVILPRFPSRVAYQSLSNRTCPMPEDLDGQRARAHQVAERTKANKAAAAAGLPPPERGPDLGPPPMSSAMPLPPPANGDPYAAPYNDRTAPYMPPADPYYGGAGGRDFYGGPDRMGGPPPPGPPPPAAAAAGGAPYMPPYLRDSDGGRGAPPPPSSAPYEYRAHPSSANNYGYSPPAPDRYGGGGGNAAPYGSLNLCSSLLDRN